MIRELNMSAGQRSEPPFMMTTCVRREGRHTMGSTRQPVSARTLFPYWKTKYVKSTEGVSTHIWVQHVSLSTPKASYYNEK